MIQRLKIPIFFVALVCCLAAVPAVFAETPTISNAKITSSASDTKTAKNGDSIVYTFTSNRQVTLPDKTTVYGKNLDFKEDKASDGKSYTYTASIKADFNQDKTISGDDLTDFSIKDSETGDSVDVHFDGTVKYTSKASLGSISVKGTKTVNNTHYVVSGKKLTISFTSDKQLQVKGKPAVGSMEGGAFEESSTDGSYTYTSTTTIPSSLKDGEELKIDVSGCKYTQGSYGETALSNSKLDISKVTYYGTEKITDVKYKDLPDDNIVYDGMTLTLSFTSNHELENADDIFSIGDTKFKFSKTGDFGNYTYTGTAKIPSNQFKNKDKIKLKSEAAKDIYGNTLDKPSTPDTTLTYYAPLKAGESITDAALSTDNKGVSFNNNQLSLIRNGNAVTASFKSDRPVTVSSAYLQGSNGKRDFTISNTPKDGVGTWSFSMQVDNGDFQDNDKIDAVIQVKDKKEYTDNQITLKTGKELVINDNENFKKLCYYAPIHADNLAFKSNNKKSSALAKNGDVISLSFSSSHPVDVANASIAGGGVNTAVKDDKTNYALTRTADGSFDEGQIPFTLELTDNAGNHFSVSSKDVKDKVTYYPPLKLASKPTMTSDNDRDGKKYCKNGDTVTFAYKLNHSAQTKGTVAGVSRSDEGEAPKLSAKISGGLKDLSEIAAAATSEDAAGNTLEVGSQEAENHITYYSPITGNASVSATGGKTPGYIKNGSTVTTHFNSNLAAAHKTDITQTTVNGRSIGSSSGNSVTYRIPEGESSLPEGKITCSVNVDDPAGNTFKATEGTDIIYDRTKPNIKIGPDVNGFYNKDVRLTVSFDDTNLDAGDMQINVNGDNKYKGGANGSTYSQNIVFGDEKEYALEAKATDKAGNTSKGNSGKVIIDKTNPKITAIDLDLKKNPAYKEGFILGKHFKITDKYLKNVTCTLTSKTGLGGTRVINIMDPINSEGLKLSEIVADDMAQNTSKKLDYDFYIDGTAPKIKLSSADSNIELSNTELLKAKPSDTLRIKCDKIWVGDEKPDHFTKLQLEDMNSNVVKDYLKDQEDNETHEADISLRGLKNGTYRLKTNAVDDVGNKMDDKIYSISVNHKNESIKIQAERSDKVKKSGAKVAVITGIAAVAAAVVIIMRKKAKLG